MYFSVILILADGVAKTEIIEHPTEKLADKLAYQLQLAWNDGEAWGEGNAKKRT